MDCEISPHKNMVLEPSVSVKQKQNQALKEYATIKSRLTSNRKGVKVACNVQTTFQSLSDCVKAKIKISAKPNEVVIFKFTIANESKRDDIMVESVELVHGKCNFCCKNNLIKPQQLTPRTRFREDIPVQFFTAHIGQYQDTIAFKFLNISTNETITIVRNIIVFVEETKSEHEKGFSPYACKEVTADMIYRSPQSNHGNGLFLIPKNNKSIYLSALKVDPKADQQMKILAQDLRKAFEVGVTKANYEKFFHNLLWYEETVVRVNIKKYNMSGVKIVNQGLYYSLRVPGLAEKRPSLMNGDMLFVRPHNQYDFMFEAVIKDINDNTADISGFHPYFAKVFKNDGLFDVRFFTSRIPLERMHVAIHNITGNGLEPRIFPVEQSKNNCKRPIIDFYNPCVEHNTEQRMAVEHIVSGTSGTAPYLVHGPPGTGKTVTIVEAILQLVKKNPANRILVCTDSNMAADHVATLLVKYAHMFGGDKFLLRASSKYRVWETLPESLRDYSNGTNRDNFWSVSIQDFMTFNIVITTLSHAAKYGRELLMLKLKRSVTHIFIDEAAQASEPASLIPVSSLLTSNGQLVLAGDPHQLGPVVISYNASKIGLGKSLMERLKELPMYSYEVNNPNYIVMLRNNFRSNKEILDIPDKLFYKGQLKALAEDDPLSYVDILGEKPQSHATVFHGVMSKEQRVGKSPSYFNAMECDLVKQYVVALVKTHKVSLADIGIVTPYIRQVYMVKRMLEKLHYEKIEVGTVEAYQGKEKRVIIISTVRANCNLLDHDAKFQLGFLVDDKRFNVAITRAKAKVIIIGNPLCLEKDLKWRAYLQKCRDLGTYRGFDSEEAKHDEMGDDIIARIQSMINDCKISPDEDKK